MVQSVGEMIEVDFNIVFFWGEGRQGGVFVIASVLKGSILKGDMAKSIFVQDCRPSPGTDERLIGESFFKTFVFL